MVKDAIDVHYKGTHLGAVSYDTDTGAGAFEYTSDFIKTGPQVSPLKMPLSSRIYQFPALNQETFKGLPGLIADSLPDDFGNAVLNSWISSQGRSVSDITPLERLKYTGKRGMGALEFSPATPMRGLNAAQNIQLDQLVLIAQEVLDKRESFAIDLQPGGPEDREAMLALLSVGTSAGGARPKAVLAFNKDFTQVRSGQTDIPDGFNHYLMKFDGVSEHNKSRETFGDPTGFGAMEYVYSLMARDSGIDMMPCHLLPEGNRRHFLTRRFDRHGNDKVHVQTLNGLAHIDYKMPGSSSYEELFAVARQLKLKADAAEQLFRRMAFNIIARNHDDHAKNFAFLLDGHSWRLAPAYDLAYSYKPGSKWVNNHWMPLNGKRDDFTRKDFYALEKISPLFSRQWINRQLDQIIDTVSQWPQRAKDHEIATGLIDEIASNLRLHI